MDVSAQKSMDKSSPGEETDSPGDVFCAKMGGNVTITVNASSEFWIRKGPVTYTDREGAWGEWKSEDLEEKEEVLWCCSISAEEGIEFFVQAVDI